MMMEDKYREVIKACGYMTYGQLQDLFNITENDYTLGNLLSMVLRKEPDELIKLYKEYETRNRK